MAEKIIQKYYIDLLKVLPMNDVMFIGRLYSTGLLSDNLKKEVQSKPTAADKADYFLQHGIKNDTDSFNKLLTIMEKHNGDCLRELADNLHKEMTSNNLVILSF